MSDQTDRFPPPSEQPVEPAGSSGYEGGTLADHEKEKPADAAGEDEGSAAQEDDEGHLKEDQKTPTS